MGLDDANLAALNSAPSQPQNLELNQLQFGQSRLQQQLDDGTVGPEIGHPLMQQISGRIGQLRSALAAHADATMNAQTQQALGAAMTQAVAQGHQRTHGAQTAHTGVANLRRPDGTIVQMQHDQHGVLVPLFPDEQGQQAARSNNPALVVRMVDQVREEMNHIAPLPPYPTQAERDAFEAHIHQQVNRRMADLQQHMMPQQQGGRPHWNQDLRQWEFPNQGPASAPREQAVAAMALRSEAGFHAARQREQQLLQQYTDPDGTVRPDLMSNEAAQGIMQARQEQQRHHQDFMRAYWAQRGGPPGQAPAAGGQPASATPSGPYPWQRQGQPTIPYEQARQIHDHVLAGMRHEIDQLRHPRQGEPEPERPEWHAGGQPFENEFNTRVQDMIRRLGTIQRGGASSGASTPGRGQPNANSETQTAQGPLSPQSPTPAGGGQSQPGSAQPFSLDNPATPAAQEFVRAHQARLESIQALPVHADSRAAATAHANRIARLAAQYGGIDNLLRHGSAADRAQYQESYDTLHRIEHAPPAHRHQPLNDQPLNYLLGLVGSAPGQAAATEAGLAPE